MKCTLCNICSDSHNHLFFNCSYTKKIWESLKMKVELSNTGNDWQDIVSSMAARNCSNNIKSILQRITLSTVVYYVWQERNARIFTQDKRDTETLLKIVTESIRMHLMSLGVKRSYQVEKVAKVWEVEMRFVYVVSCSYVKNGKFIAGINHECYEKYDENWIMLVSLDMPSFHTQTEVCEFSFTVLANVVLIIRRDQRSMTISISTIKEALAVNETSFRCPTSGGNQSKFTLSDNPWFHHIRFMEFEPSSSATITATITTTTTPITTTAATFTTADETKGSTLGCHRKSKLSSEEKNQLLHKEKVIGFPTHRSCASPVLNSFDTLDLIRVVPTYHQDEDEDEDAHAIQDDNPTINKLIYL
ncbi:hypothetical protein Tco_0657597 [Tanacetum coccineum]